MAAGKPARPVLGIEFDPVAGELSVLDAWGRATFTLPAAGAIAKHFRDDGTLYCIFQGDEAVLAFYDPGGAPIPMSLTKADGGWRVVPANA